MPQAGRGCPAGRHERNRAWRLPTARLAAVAYQLDTEYMGQCQRKKQILP